MTRNDFFEGGGSKIPSIKSSLKPLLGERFSIPNFNEANRKTWICLFVDFLLLLPNHHVFTTIWEKYFVFFVNDPNKQI